MTSAARPAAWLLALGLLALPACGRAPQATLSTSTSEARWSLEGAVMGTTWHARGGLAPGTDLALVLRELQASLDRIDALMSTWSPASELSRFNAGPGGAPFPVSEETATVVEAALALAAASGGAFDPTVMPLVDLWGFGPAGREVAAPDEDALAAAMADTGWERIRVDRPADGPPTLWKESDALGLDLSAIAKGFGVDQACAALDRLGIEDYMVEVGGELRCKGTAAEGRAWRIGIDAPREGALPGASLQTVLAPGDRAVATSGDYRNWREVDGVRLSHTIDPRDGRPTAHALASVSILAADCMTADALATACMTLGPDGALELVEATAGAEALLVVRVDEDFASRRSSGWPDPED